MFLLASITENSQCMEQPKQLQKEITENKLGSFSNFQDEHIAYLFSFIPEASSMKEIFKKLAQLSLVNSKFKEIAEDKVLLKELAKRLIKFHRLEAEKLFVDTADRIMSGNKKHKKILSVLTADINSVIATQVLFHAASRGNRDLVKLLLNNGANVNAKGTNGHTALMLASIKESNTEMVKFLLDSGANVNAANRGGKTALMYASKQGNKEIVQLLLDKGANANAKSTNGDTALILAACHGHQDVVKILINAGADANAADRDGITSLMWASSNGHKEIVELLLSKGVNVDAYSSNYRSALMLASYGGHKQIVQLLLDRSADITIKNIQGNTALILNLISLYEGHWGIGNYDITEIASLLLEADFFNGYRGDLNVNAANNDGETALMWAARLNCIELIYVLIDRGGADVDAENKMGETALMIALKLGNTKAAEFLRGYPRKRHTIAYSAKSSNCVLQ